MGKKKWEDEGLPVTEPDHSIATPEQVANGQPPPKLSPRERALKHGRNRVLKALKALRAVGQFGSRASYEFSPAQYQEMIDLISDEWDRATCRLRGEKPKTDLFLLL